MAEEQYNKISRYAKPTIELATLTLGIDSYSNMVLLRGQIEPALFAETMNRLKPNHELLPQMIVILKIVLEAFDYIESSVKRNTK